MKLSKKIEVATYIFELSGEELDMLIERTEHWYNGVQVYKGDKKKDITQKQKMSEFISKLHADLKKAKK